LYLTYFPFFDSLLFGGDFDSLSTGYCQTEYQNMILKYRITRCEDDCDWSLAFVEVAAAT